MKKNVGIIDTVIRLVLAALIVVLYFTNVISGAIGITLLAVAGLLVLTSIVSICPLYSVLKISTRKKK
jgi:hypothetical protein